MIRLPGREVDITNAEAVREAGAEAVAKRLEDEGFRGFLEEVQRRYVEAGAPLVLSTGALRQFLAALTDIWEGKEPRLETVQPSLREKVVKPLMDSMKSQNWAKEFTLRVAQEFLASVGNVPQEYKERLSRYPEELWQEVEKAINKAIVLYQDESGRIYKNQEELVKFIVHNTHARLSALLRLELLRM